MILRAEKVLGGAVLTVRYEEAIDRIEGCSILTLTEVRALCEAIDNRAMFVQGESFFVTHPNRDCVMFVMQAEEPCTMPLRMAQSLRDYLIKGNPSKVWQLGEDTK